MIVPSLTRFVAWRCLAGFATVPEFLQPLPNDRFVATINRLVIAAILWQVGLLDPTALVVMAVLVAGAVTEPFRAAVRSVAQMFRHRQRSARTNVFAGLADRRRGRIGLRRRRDVRDSLRKRELAFRQAHELGCLERGGGN